MPTHRNKTARIHQILAPPAGTPAACRRDSNSQPPDPKSYFFILPVYMVDSRLRSTHYVYIFIYFVYNFHAVALRLYQNASV